MVETRVNLNEINLELYSFKAFFVDKSLINKNFVEFYSKIDDAIFQIFLLLIFPLRIVLCSIAFNKIPYKHHNTKQKIPFFL